MNKNQLTATQRAIPYLQLVGAAVLWSLGGVLIKSADWPAPAIAGARSLIAAFVLLPFLKGRFKISGAKEILAIVAYALTLYTFVLATRNTTAANAIVLQYTAPLHVALLSALVLGERITRIDWFFVFLALGGMVLFFVESLSPEGFVGNLYAIASGVCFGAMIILLSALKDSYPLRAVTYGNILVFLISLPSLPSALPSSQTTWVLLVLGVFQIAIPYVLFTNALKKVRAIDGVLIPVLEPILNPLWVLIIIGERPGMWALIGSVVVVGSITARTLLQITQSEKQGTASTHP